MNEHMVRVVDAIEPRRFTVEEYQRMAESGVFEPGERVELIRGVVRRMSPKNYAHVVAATKLHQFLVKALEGRASVFKEDPLKLVRLDSEPEPDIVATSSARIEDYGTESAKPLLVAEVAASSLRFDLNAKAPLYAEASVPEYWVVNLVARELVVFRLPEHGLYRSCRTYGEGDRVVPASWPDVAIQVADLFPQSDPEGDSPLE